MGMHVSIACRQDRGRCCRRRRGQASSTGLVATGRAYRCTKPQRGRTCRAEHPCKADPAPVAANDPWLRRSRSRCMSRRLASLAYRQRLVAPVAGFRGIGSSVRYPDVEGCSGHRRPPYGNRVVVVCRECTTRSSSLLNVSCLRPPFLYGAKTSAPSQSFPFLRQRRGLLYGKGLGCTGSDRPKAA